MARLHLSDAHVEIPVFTSRSRGLINSLFRYAKRENDRIQALGANNLQVKALRGINLTISDGDKVGLVGENGAGKTTLLRLLSGAYDPTRGAVEISGSVGSLTDLTIGMDLEADGYENIRMRGLYFGLTRQAIDRFTADVEGFAELGDYLQLPVRTYSAGMMLRLAFAMSTAYAPDILLMDEMVGAGDARFLVRAQERLEKVMTTAGILVLASHNEEIIRKFCNRAVCLRSGRVAFDGATDDCLNFYREQMSAQRRDDVA